MHVLTAVGNFPLSLRAQIQHRREVQAGAQVKSYREPETAINTRKRLLSLVLFAETKARPDSLLIGHPGPDTPTLGCLFCISASRTGSCVSRQIRGSTKGWLLSHSVACNFVCPHFIFHIAVKYANNTCYQNAIFLKFMLSSTFPYLYVIKCLLLRPAVRDPNMMSINRRSSEPFVILYILYFLLCVY